MPNEDSSAPPPELRPLPAAWQPVTPRGVAAFSCARLGRLLLVQFLVAALTSAAVVWFLSTAWFPVALQAIRQLPESGSIAGRQLDTPRDSALPLAQNRFIAFFADTNAVSNAGLTADLRISFHRDRFAVCSLFGCLALDYPSGAPVPFNRLELEPWWGAWEPMWLGSACLAAVGFLFLSWLTLATLYAPVAWVAAYLKDRQLTLSGSWKLASAALLPGALLATVGLVLYGLGVLDLLRLLLLWVMHLLVGWVYLGSAILALPRAATAVPPLKDPFATTSTKSPLRPVNPFAAPGSKPESTAKSVPARDS